MGEERSIPVYWLGIAAVAAVYVGAAKIGLTVSVAHGNVTPVWAPTGIALAALLLLGYRYWPGIAIGAFVANATTPIPVWVAVTISAGNTLEGLAGAYLLRRFVGFRNQLDRVRDVLALVLLGAAISTCIAATIGTTSLWLAGDVPLAGYGFAWRLWWFGDAMGALLVAPLLLAWGSNPIRRLVMRREVVEGVALLALLVTASWVVFFGGRWRYPYLLFPILVWAALRFRQQGASLAIFVMTALGVAGTLEGSVPIGGANLTDSVQILQVLMGLLAVTTLVLAATLTEREQGQWEREESLSLLRATLESTADGILVVDPEGRVIATNDKFAEMWRIPQEVLDSQDDDKLLAFVVDQLVAPEVFLDKVREFYARPQTEGRDVLRFKDGRVFERYSQPRYDADRIVGRVSSFRDITEKTKAEERLRRETARREQFIANAAHELRTPVTVLYGLASLIQANGVDMPEEQVAASIDGMKRQGERLRDLVNNLLDLSALQGGMLRINPRPVPLHEVVGTAVESLPLPDGKRVSAAIDERLVVEADPDRLEQMLTNLLNNAYRHGGDSILLEAQESDGRVLVSISDDGPGVPHELVPELFEAFTRAHHPGYSGGSGLGLAIVRSLAQASGAEVWYEPGPRAGARFVLALPRARS